MRAQLIGSTIWILCPRCGQKLHPVKVDAECHGVGTQCKKCGWSGEIIIENMAELREAQGWQALRNTKHERAYTTK